MSSQGFPVFALTDSNNVNCFEVPSFPAAPSITAKGGPTLISRTLITSAQLLLLKTTGVSLIPAAGANTVITLDTVSLHYLFLTTAYTLNAGTLRLFYGPQASALPLCADQSVGLIDQAANRTIPSVPLTLIAVQTDANGINQPITLGNTGAANFTLGVGTLVVTCTYNIVNV